MSLSIVLSIVTVCVSWILQVPVKVRVLETLEMLFLCMFGVLFSNEMSVLYLRLSFCVL